MFRELFTALRAGDTMDEAFAELGQMLAHGQWMYGRAIAVFDMRGDAGEIRREIYEKDKEINNLLRSIRRKIVRHLAINPGYDVAAGLTLVSVAKDAERVGDYCKNLFDVGRWHNRDFTAERYREPLNEVRNTLTDLFERVRTAFARSSTSQAKEAINVCEGIGRRCDRVVEQLLNDDGQLAIGEAAAYALLARHCKRIASHLANICTAMVADVEDLDFHS